MIFRWLLFCASALLTSCGGGSSSSSSVEPTTLIAVGDIAQCTTGVAVADTVASKTAALTASILAEKKSSAGVLTLGDNVYYAGTPAEFSDCYEPTWGKLKSVTWPTPGNHDYGIAGASGYFDYFGSLAGTDRKGFYSKSLSGWLILSLNSNVDAQTGSEQYNWVESEIIKSANGCILAVWHHPMFTTAVRGDNGKMRDIFNLLVAKNADLVLQGHEHQFERFHPMLGSGAMDASGLMSMVIGTGGASLYDFSPNVHPGSAARVRDFGVLQLDLSLGKASFKFVNLERKPLDQGEVICKAKPKLV
jgi:acid phosphatase type 7